MYLIKNPKVLCFTPSFNRFKMLRGCIFDIKNQSYKNITHSINIANDGKNPDDIMKLFDDIDFCKIVINENNHQHINYLNAIKNINVDDYDIFIPIADDDIFKKNYVETIVNYFENNEVDVISSKIKIQLNGCLIRNGLYNNLGGNPDNYDFKMPPTFAFNRKCAKLIVNLTNIYGWEDHMWRDVWAQNNCILKEIDNSENIIWYIHGKNTAVSNFLDTSQE